MTGLDRGCRTKRVSTWAKSGAARAGELVEGFAGAVVALEDERRDHVEGCVSERAAEVAEVPDLLPRDDVLRADVLRAGAVALPGVWRALLQRREGVGQARELVDSLN